jgi:uncharacterized protein (UPF0276 family)
VQPGTERGVSAPTVEPRDTGAAHPGLALTYEGHDSVLLERVLPLVDYVEITPDAMSRADGDGARLDPDALAELKAIGDDARIIVHGVGLTIASHEGWSHRYVGLLDELVAEVEIAWHSEHLAYTTVDGEHLGTMLPPPRTEEVLDLVCDRVGSLQRRYGVPFLLENVINLLPDPGGDHSPAGFFNEIAAHTDCGFLVDVYNLECDAHNYALDVAAYFDELDLARAWEVHVADGTEHRGFRLDAHTGLTRDETLALADDVVERAGGAVRAVNYELLAEAVPLVGHDAIVHELERLRAHFA